MNEINHRYTNDVVCPHCGHEHSDSWEYEDSGEEECAECEKTFTFERHVEVTYCTSKPK